MINEKMRKVLEKINIYYSKQDNLDKHEIDFFKITSNILNEIDKQEKMIFEAENAAEFLGWKKHISYLFESYCNDLGVTKVQIRCPDRTKELVDARQKIAKQLSSKKFSHQQIGWVMARDRSSIYNLIVIRP